MKEAHKEALVAARQTAAENRARGTIRLTDTYTLEPIDDRNWALCKDGSPEAYWSSLDQALTGVARRLMDRSLRANLKATAIQDLASVVTRARDAIVAELRQRG
jgi:hypothetical protein